MFAFSGRGGSDGKEADPSPGPPQTKTKRLKTFTPTAWANFQFTRRLRYGDIDTPDNNPIIAAINRAASTQASTQETAHAATQNMVREQIDKLGAEVNERIDKLGEDLGLLRADLKNPQERRQRLQ